MSQNLNRLREAQERINLLLQEQVALQSRGEDLDEARLARLTRLQNVETALLSLQERRVNNQYRGNRAAGELTGQLSDQLSELSSISAIYSKLIDKQKLSITTARTSLTDIISQQNASQEQVDTITQIASKATELQSIQQKIAESDSTQLELQNSLRDKHEGVVTNVERQIALALAQNKITQEQATALTSLLNSQQSNLQVAEEYATVSSETKQRIDAQIDAYDKMKKTVSGTLDTIRMTLQTPQAMIVAASAAAGKFADAMGDVNKQTGMFIGSTAALSFVFDDAAGTLSQMAKLSGDVNKATFMSQLNTNVLATSMGIGGEEAATLVNAFGNLSGQSMETGENMVSAMGATARMKGVLPSQAMKDMAAATEAMAVYSKGTGENFANAAIQAAQLGISVADTAKMADTLLDFETSIEKELEASAMLGKDINLTRARELAYAGDLEGMTKEILNQVGEFPDDPYQQKALADALGIGVAELKQMVANQENLNTASGKFEQTVGMANDYLRAIGEKFGGPIASGVTFFLGELIRAKMTAAAINGTSMFGGMGDKLKGLGSRIFGGGAAPSVPTGPTTPSTPSTPTGGADQANKFGKIKANDLIKGAAALLIIAAALYVSAKAFQEFASVAWGDVGKGLVGIAGLAGIAYVLGKAEKEMIKGAFAIAVLGIALIPFAFAMSLIAGLDIDSVIAAAAGLIIFGAAVFGLGALITGPGAIIFGAGILGFLALGAALIVLGAGLQMVGNGFSAIASGLPLLVEQVSTMAQIDFLPIFGLAGALTALAFALGLVSTMGLLALPVLAAIGLVAGGAAALMGGGGGEEKGGMLEEIKGLRNDLASGKIAVYMDGQLVTSKVANVASKNPVT